MFTTDALSAALAGRYTIDRLVGEGGMAKVYLARDLRTQGRARISQHEAATRYSLPSQSGGVARGRVPTGMSSDGDRRRRHARELLLTLESPTQPTRYLNRSSRRGAFEAGY